MNGKKALCLASMASNLDNFNRGNVELLQSLGYEVTLASNFSTGEDINSREKIDSFLKEMHDIGVRTVQIDFSRSVFKLGRHRKAYRQVRDLLKEGFDLLHCHTPVGAAIARLCARKLQKRGQIKVIYTAHGFHFFKGAPLAYWMLFYPTEKYLSRFTDVLITINKEDYERASKKFRAKKTVYVPGIGVDVEGLGRKSEEENGEWERIDKDSAERKNVERDNNDKDIAERVCLEEDSTKQKCSEKSTHRDRIRQELGIPSDAKLLISVGELSKRKNHLPVIEALNEINNPDIYYVIAGKGALAEKLKAADKTGRLILTGYRSNISELLHTSDLFVFPSLQEGLPVALMEAMAAGVPCICSRIRGNTDLVTDEKFLFDPRSKKSIKEAIEHFLIASGQEIRDEVEKNRLAVSACDKKAVMERMREVYLEI